MSDIVGRRMVGCVRGRGEADHFTICAFGQRLDMRRRERVLDHERACTAEAQGSAALLARPSGQMNWFDRLPVQNSKEPGGRFHRPLNCPIFGCAALSPPEPIPNLHGFVNFPAEYLTFLSSFPPPSRI